MQRRLITICTILLITGGMYAQSPYAWAFSAKKTTNSTYEVHCTMEIKPSWHTYSEFTPDGGPLATIFRFAKNPLYSLEGEVKEIGKLQSHHEEVFDVDVKYFEDRVDFVQLIKLKGNTKTNVSGSVEFMVCNDRQCLPPTIQKFTIPLN